MPADKVDWEEQRSYGERGGFSQPSAWFEGVRGRSIEMEQVQAEVLSEQRGRVALVSHDAQLSRLLLAQIRGQPLVVEERGVVQDEGVFILLNPDAITSTPETELFGSEEAFDTFNDSFPSARMNYGFHREKQLHRALLDELAEVDSILYLWQFDDGWQAIDAHWYARLRATAIPTALVAISPPDVDEAAVEEVRRLHGFRPLLLSLCQRDAEASIPATDLLRLLERLLTLCPRLAIALAQESPIWRPAIVHRVVRMGALMTGLLGAEPLPLLDLPLQLAMQWKVALQISAIYGRPGLDYRSREMLGALILNLLIRAVAQQLLKLMPMVGWLLSAALSASSTWLLGTTLARYYEEERLIDLSKFDLSKMGLNKIDLRRFALKKAHLPISQWPVVVDAIRQHLRLQNLGKWRSQKNHTEGTRATPLAKSESGIGVNSEVNLGEIPLVDDSNRASEL